MKEIRLSQGEVALVDDEDYEYLSQWDWCVQNWYNKRKYAVRNENKKTIQMHRIIVDPPMDMDVDHIDHNGLNNQKYNLRICTHAQNIRNRRAFGSSNYLGVSWDKSRNKWKATLQTREYGKNKKTHLSKRFNTEIEAALAYDEKAKELFGEFANLNFKTPL